MSFITFAEVMTERLTVLRIKHDTSVITTIFPTQT